GIVINVTLLKIKEERRFLFRDRSAEIAAVLSRRIWRTRGRKWIARVERHVVEAKRGLPAKLIRAWFCQDFNSSEARTIILGRKWISVNANLADRSQRRHHASGESIYENLSTVRTSGRSGQGLQGSGEIIRVIRQSVQ